MAEHLTPSQLVSSLVVDGASMGTSNGADVEAGRQVSDRGIVDFDIEMQVLGVIDELANNGGFLPDGNASPRTTTQDGDGRLNIAPAPVNDDDAQGGGNRWQPLQIIKSPWTISIVTLTSVIATFLYKPARGVVFGPNKVAYYLTLCVILVAGLAEAFTAFWISRNADSRRTSVGRVVLCASVGPLVTIIAIGGFAVTEG